MWGSDFSEWFQIHVSSGSPGSSVAWQIRVDVFSATLPPGLVAQGRSACPGLGVCECSIPWSPIIRHFDHGSHATGGRRGAGVASLRESPGDNRRLGRLTASPGTLDLQQKQAGPDGKAKATQGETEPKERGGGRASGLPGLEDRHGLGLPPEGGPDIHASAGLAARPHAPQSFTLGGPRDLVGPGRDPTLGSPTGSGDP